MNTRMRWKLWVVLLAIGCLLSNGRAQPPGNGWQPAGLPPMVQDFSTKLATVHATPAAKAQFLEQMKNWMTQHGGSEVDAKLVEIGKIFDKASALNDADFQKNQQDLAWQIFRQFRASATPASAGQSQSQMPQRGAVQPNREPVGKGLRIFTIAHSFHSWLPDWLREIAVSAGIDAPGIVGVSSIGGSEIIQHWNVPDERNQAKQALATGKVDVLTMSPKWRTDEGIEKFAALAVEHNPNIRITVQEFWMPMDELQDFGELGKTLRTWKDPAPDPDQRKENQNPAHFNVPTGTQLRNLHAPYFKRMDEHITALNKQFGKRALVIVPVGQAVIALRELVAAGKAPGIAKQSDLFRDKTGHPRAVICALAAYCHFAVIYQQSPVGLPIPAQLAREYNDPKLNRLLQEIAWDAVIHHPLSGISGNNQVAAKPSAAAPVADPVITPPPQAEPSQLKWIDVHNHLYPNQGSREFTESIRAALAQMDQVGISKMVVLPPPGGFCADSVFLKAGPQACGTNRSRFVFGAGNDLNEMIEGKVADTTARTFEQKANALVDQGAGIFGEIFIMHLLIPGLEFGVPADHPLLLLLADIAARRDVPLDVHFDLIAEDQPGPEHVDADRAKQHPQLFHNNLPAFERLLAHNPKAKIIWEHVGGDPFGYCTPELCYQLLKKYPNLYMAMRLGTCKPPENTPMASPHELRPTWLHLFQDFPDRFMIGRDGFIKADGQPETRGAYLWTRCLLNTLPADLARKIAYENASALFKIKD